MGYGAWLLTGPAQPTGQRNTCVHIFMEAAMRMYESDFESRGIQSEPLVIFRHNTNGCTVMLVEAEDCLAKEADAIGARQRSLEVSAA